MNRTLDCLSTAMPLRPRALHRDRSLNGVGLRWIAPGLLALLMAATAPAQAQAPAASAASAARSSAMDAELFYQLMISELELRRGESAVAIQVMREAAERHRDERLFRRAVDMAIEARAADQAMATLKAWRQSLPRSTAAAEMQAQVLMALGRPDEAQEAVRALIELTPVPQRPAMIATVPRLVLRGAQAKAAAEALDKVLKPWREQAGTRLSAQIATARLWLAAGDTGRSLDAAREAQQTDAGSDITALVALELMGQEPRAEALVQSYLKTPRPSAETRLGYARRLTAAQRYREALEQARAAVATEPTLTPAWLMQGALLLELGQPREAQPVLERYLALKQEPRRAAPGTDTSAAKPDDDTDNDDDPDDSSPHGPRAEAAQEMAQAYLMLAQAAEQLKDYPGAQAWLEKLGDAQAGGAGVVQRRASLLARQGKLAEARALIRTLPEGTPEEARAKVMSETQLLRDEHQWRAAYDLLAEANARFNNDPDLLYEQALLAEKLRRFSEMEQLLRRVIEIKPDQQHAYNALGYSLADRGVRLPEARELVAKALALAPGDPFITDSMGWVEFRMGNRAEAIKLLRGAYERRPDVEIGAHLGEVLWVDGQRDAARLIWRAGKERDATNEVLADTLARLKVRL